MVISAEDFQEMGVDYPELNRDGDKKMKNDPELDKWFKSLETMLGGIDHSKVEASSIFLVPKHIRQSKMEVYKPHLFSIGPLHKGTSRDLLYMEKIKWFYMLRLLLRCKNPEIALRHCGNNMLESDEIVRASYTVDDVKFNRNDLAKIMLLDGCFLLELIICGSPSLNDRLKLRVDGLSNPGNEMIKSQELLVDLTLIENQIPLFVLDNIAYILFPEYFARVDSIKLIHEHALSLFGYDYSILRGRDFDVKPFHLVELVHSFIQKEKDELLVQKEGKNVKVSIDIEKSSLLAGN